jgi:penicillin-binding protein 1C
VKGPHLIRTTLDLDLQHRLEEVLRSHKVRLTDLGAAQAAALVVQNEDCSVLALAGSIGYGPLDQGYNNGTQAERSPGSALKPFLYGLALESGYSAASVLEDTERRYQASGGEYFPRNYDRRDYGPATLRTALGNSLNLSAVSLIGRLGVPNFHHTLSTLGLVNDPSRTPESYGLGLAIGNPEVTLEQLTAAYTMLANGGLHRPLRYRSAESLSAGRRAFTPQTAFILADILSDPTARALTFGFSSELDFPYRVAWKTGTSTRYRDGWIVGFTPKYTVGVWTGNFDGSPMKETGGATGAGPLFSEILHFLYRSSSPQPFLPPDGLTQTEICSHSGMLPGPFCPARMKEWFLADAPPSQTCSFHKKEGLRHRLDSPFAGWVFDRHQHSSSTPYRLDDGETANFSDPWQPLLPGDGTAAVRVLGPSQATIAPASTNPSVVAPGRRVSIGSSRKDHLNLDPSASNRIEIIYPLDGDRILFPENGDPVPLMFQARLDGPASQVAWYVDGVEYVRTGPPYRASWQLARGGHRITVVGEDGWGDEITIQVE